MKMFIINICGLIFTIFGCLTLRFHYIIDVTSGIIIANWIFILYEKYENKINERGMKI